METLAIIVPCYNEQEALPLFYKEASKVLEKLDYDYKLLLINDGSKDNTLSIMKSIAEKDEHVKYLSFSRNFGKEAAMYAGFCNANADYVCVMDADMQDPPSLLCKGFSPDEKGNGGSDCQHDRIQSIFQRNFWLDWVQNILVIL